MHPRHISAVSAILLLCLPLISHGATPIARFNVVPYQRIAAGETFNIGVVAFSKDGIERVEFRVDGQGYTGPNPLVTHEMTYNARTGVFEYWVPLRAADFASDGPVAVSAVVYGKTGEHRDKQWLIEDTFGATYGVSCRVESSSNHHQYLCDITSAGLFDPDLIYSDLLLHKNSQSWWQGVRETVYQADANTLTVHIGDTWGANPVTLDYQPATGDPFILSRGFGLDPLVLVVNPMGSLPAPVAYVDTAGDDDTGTVDNPALPFATVGGAMLGIRDWMNANGPGPGLQGGIIRLNPGIHTQSNGGFWGTISGRDEWLTITSNPALGGTQENTRLYNGSMISTDLIKVQELTLITDSAGSNVFAPASTYRHKFKLWVADCRLEGNTRFSELSNPVSAMHLWYTDVYFTNMGKAVSEARLARNVTIEHIGDDAFVRSPFVVNARAVDIDPRDGTCEGGGCAHADCWQWWGGPVPHNMIIYGLDCVDCTYQGLFARTQDGNVPVGFQNPPAEGVAIVNLHTKLIAPASFADNSWYISTRHMLLWHNSFNTDFNFWNDGDSGGYRYPLNIVDFDVRGNRFFNLELNAAIGDDNGGDPQAPGIELSGWANNHYVQGPESGFYNETPGTNAQMDDAVVDAQGNPLSESPLIDGWTRSPIPVDAINRSRMALPDMGAIEFN